MGNVFTMNYIIKEHELKIKICPYCSKQFNKLEIHIKNCKQKINP